MKSYTEVTPSECRGVCYIKSSPQKMLINAEGASQRMHSGAVSSFECAVFGERIFLNGGSSE